MADLSLSAIDLPMVLTRNTVLTLNGLRQLPEGFSIKEDEDFVRLVYKDREVGCYSAVGVTGDTLYRDAAERTGKRPES